MGSYDLQVTENVSAIPAVSGRVTLSSPSTQTVWNCIVSRWMLLSLSMEIKVRLNALEKR